MRWEVLQHLSRPWQALFVFPLLFPVCAPFLLSLPSPYTNAYTCTFLPKLVLWKRAFIPQGWWFYFTFTHLWDVAYLLFSARKLFLSWVGKELWTLAEVILSFVARSDPIFCSQKLRHPLLQQILGNPSLVIWDTPTPGLNISFKKKKNTRKTKCHGIEEQEAALNT